MTSLDSRPNGLSTAAQPPAVAAVEQITGALVSAVQLAERNRQAKLALDLRAAEGLYDLQQARIKAHSAALASIQPRHEAVKLNAAVSPRANSAAAPLAAEAWPNQILRSADPSDPDGKCSPWFAAKDENGFSFADIDVSFCGYGPELPMASLQDLSLSWKFRSRSGDSLSARYKVLIMCISACQSGWYDFEQLIPPQQVSGFSRGSFGGWAVLDLQITELRQQ